MIVKLQLSNVSAVVKIDDKNYSLYQLVENTFIDKKGVKSPRFGETEEKEVGHYKNMALALEKLVQLNVASIDEEVELESYIRIIRDNYQALEAQLR